MKCPYCKEEIQEGATVCPHCRKRIESPGSKKWKALAGIGLGVVIMSCMCFGLGMMMQGSLSPDAYSMTVTIGMLMAAAGIVALLVGLIGKGFSK